ncbi:MAG: DMP19 family protein [Bacteroidaceae bacterium]
MDALLLLPTAEQLEAAGKKGFDAFLQLYYDIYWERLGGSITSESIPRLSGEQHAIISYMILREEVMDGGFIQLIQNGYGGYIFDNPFAKAMRIFGAKDLSKLIYKAKKLYDEHRIVLEKERTDEEFMALYEEFEQFDDLDDEFIIMEQEASMIVSSYIDEHLELFYVEKEN